MNLSVNPLVKEGKENVEWKWLIEKPISMKEEKNMGKSQYKTDFTNHLINSVLKIYHILPHSWKLNRNKLYEIFNAQTLQRIIENLLKDTEQQEVLKKFKHDFRTTELARMLYEVVREYVLDSADTESIRSDLNRVSDRLIEKSKLELKNESSASHANQKNRALTEKREKELIEKREEFKKELREMWNNKKHKELEKKIRNLKNDKTNIEIRMLDKNNGKLSQTKQNTLNNLKNEYDNKIKNLESQLLKLENDIRKNIEKINTEMEKKYDHLKSYYCRKKFLPEFTYDIINKGYAIASNNDDIPMLVEPQRDGFNAMEIPLAALPKNKVITHKMRKYFTSPEYYFFVIANSKNVKWIFNEPCSPLPELRKLPILLKYHTPGIHMLSKNATQILGRGYEF